MSKRMFELLFTKAGRFFLEYKDNFYLSKICRRAKISISPAIRLNRFFEKNKLVTLVEPENTRCKFTFLTDRGKKIQEKMKDTRKKLLGEKD